jgi:peptidoglycan/LPS O-acetylase OafA/YrhL
MSIAIEAPARPTRYIELDSLRGLAALAVLLGHLEWVWTVVRPPSSEIAVSLVNLTTPFGSDAVILFFVLSGFVLSLPAVDRKPQSYFTFVVRRIFRIYVPYLAALAVAVAAAFFFYGHASRCSWWISDWSGPVTWHQVLEHVMFIGFYDTTRFDPPTWSLVYEMRISLFFPLLCAVALRFKFRWAFALALFLDCAAKVIDKLHGAATAISTSDTLRYAVLFILGIYLARERASTAGWFGRLNRPARIAFAVAFVLLFAFAGPWYGSLVARTTHPTFRFIGMWLTGLGAGGLMIICMNSSSCKRALHWPPIHFLGEVSYSLYLWHFVVLLFCVHLLYGKIPLWEILCLVFVLSIIVSWFSYRWIEVPSMNLGRKLSNPFQRPSGA